MIKGYSICLNEWALDKDIKNELGLLLIISNLCHQKGFCFANNDYFAKLFNENEGTISRKIKKLEDKKYIEITYKKRGFEIIGREIRLTKLLTVHSQNCEPTVNKNVKENNININNINKNNIYSEKNLTNVRYFSEQDQYGDLNNFYTNLGG